MVIYGEGMLLVLCGIGIVNFFRNLFSQHSESADTGGF